MATTTTNHQPTDAGTPTSWHTDRDTWEDRAERLRYRVRPSATGAGVWSAWESGRQVGEYRPGQGWLLERGAGA